MKTEKFKAYFENNDISPKETYSSSIITSIVRSVLEPLIKNNSKAIVLARLKEVEGIESIIKRLEYSSNINLKMFSDFEFSKFDVEDLGFIVLNSERYNCAFIFRKTNSQRYEIYFKINSKLVVNVYETIKATFLADFDDDFYNYKPERRENELVNEAVFNILNYFEETIKENEYNSKIQESYKTVNETNTSLRNEIYQSVRQIAHEIKNQLSILDIYARIFEKKTGDTETIDPIKKSIKVIKNQVDKFKDIDVINLQERDIKPILHECIKTYSNILKEKNNKLIFIDEMAGVDANAFVDEEKFAIIVSNIIKNAHDCTKNDEIIIKMKLVENIIKISFINHGDTIAPDNQEKIFENGFSTKKDGWGVGLAVCRKYIGSQFGMLELEKSNKDETIFALTLPLVQTK